MTLEIFKESVKKDGWISVRKDGYIYFKRRDTSKFDNQGKVYSCHTKNIDVAMETIKEWLIHGFPLTGKEKENDILFNDYIYSFWNENSDYVKSAIREGRTITKRTILDNKQRYKFHADNFFKGVKLSEINEKLLNDFVIFLFSAKSKKGAFLSNGTIKKIKSVVLTPLREGRKKGIVRQVIDFDVIGTNIKNVVVRPRGILTKEEVLTLVRHNWKDKRAYIAFMIAVTCGLRLGEIRALKIGSIQNGFIIVSHSINNVDGLKCTKTGKSRIVPCPETLLKLIADYVETLPESERGLDDFLLTCTIKAKPFLAEYCKGGFYQAMRECGIERIRENPLTGRKEYICFHSLRHYVATKWVETGIDLRLIAAAMGHSVAMLQHYADHLQLNDMQKLKNQLTACGALPSVIV